MHELAFQICLCNKYKYSLYIMYLLHNVSALLDVTIQLFYVQLGAIKFALLHCMVFLCVRKWK